MRFDKSCIIKRLDKIFMNIIKCRKKFYRHATIETENEFTKLQKKNVAQVCSCLATTFKKQRQVIFKRGSDIRKGKSPKWAEGNGQLISYIYMSEDALVQIHGIRSIHNSIWFQGVVGQWVAYQARVPKFLRS